MENTELVNEVMDEEAVDCNCQPEELCEESNGMWMVLGTAALVGAVFGAAKTVGEKAPDIVVNGVAKAKNWNETRKAKKAAKKAAKKSKTSEEENSEESAE